MSLLDICSEAAASTSVSFEAAADGRASDDVGGTSDGEAMVLDAIHSSAPDDVELAEPLPDDAPDLAERMKRMMSAFRRAPSMNVREFLASQRRYWRQREEQRAPFIAAFAFALAHAIRRFEIGVTAVREPSLLVDYPEAAAILGISVAALKSRVIRRQLPPGTIKRTGRRVQFVRSKLGGAA